MSYYWLGKGVVLQATSINTVDMELVQTTFFMYSAWVGLFSS